LLFYFLISSSIIALFHGWDPREEKEIKNSFLNENFIPQGRVLEN